MRTLQVPSVQVQATASSPLLGADVTAVLPALLLAVLLVVIHPVGYVGGGFDDYQYLQAARCAAEHGWCIPSEHWARRFPLVLPLALTIRLFGESRQVLWIIPAFYSAAAIALLVLIVKREFGAKAGALAGLVFVLTPLIADGLIMIGIDTPELAILLGSLFCLQRRSWFVAGLLYALAIHCRPTMFAMAPMFAYVFWGRPRATLWFLFGWSIPIAVESAMYWLAVGDPLRSWKLSLAHTTIESSQLKGVDLHESPLLNMHFIKAWKPSAGIAAPWPIRGLVNYVLHTDVVLTNLLLILVFLLGRHEVDRKLSVLLCAAALFFVELVFVFAIDPVPRMFLPVLAVECTVIGVLTARVTDPVHRVAIAVMMMVMTVHAVISAFDRFDYQKSGYMAAAWLAADRRLTVHPIYAQRLALLGHDWNLYRGQDAPVLTIERGNCSAASWWADPTWRVARKATIEQTEPAIIRWFRSHRVLAHDSTPTTLCVFVSKNAGDPI